MSKKLIGMSMVALLAAGQTLAAPAPAKKVVAKKAVAAKRAAPAKKVAASKGAVSEQAIATSAAAPTSAAAAPAQTSTATAPVAQKSLKDVLAVKYENIIWAGSLSSPLSNFQPYNEDQYETNKSTGKQELTAQAGTTNYSSPIFMEHYLTPSFTLNPNLKLNATMMATNKFGGDDRSLVLNDPYLTLVVPTLYSAGNYSLMGYLRSYVPVSTASQTAGRLITFRGLLEHSYEFAGTPWTASVATFVQWYGFHNGPTAHKGKDALRFYAGPSVSYKVSDNFSVSNLVEFEARTQYGTAEGLDTFNKEFINIEPSVSWTASKIVTLNFWVDIPVGKNKRTALDTSTFVVDTVFKLF